MRVSPLPDAAVTIYAVDKWMTDYNEIHPHSENTSELNQTRRASGLMGSTPVKEVFGWIKKSAGSRQTKHRGRARVGWQFDLATTIGNLIRLPGLLAAAPA